MKNDVHRASKNAYARSWRKKPENKKRYLAYFQGWRSLNGKRVKGYQLKSRYGISNADHLLMLRLQDNKCAICKEPFKSSPHVDHCHRTGKVRGLLCPGCNHGLGRFKDSITALLNAVSYLKAA